MGVCYFVRRITFRLVPNDASEWSVIIKARGNGECRFLEQLMSQPHMEACMPK